jgi:hypothetical protein
MKGIYSFIVLCFLFLANNSRAQIKVSYDDASRNKYIAAADTQGVVLHSDPRLDLLLRRHKDAMYGGIYSAHGFRVQIYNGNERTKATGVRNDFMKRFPGIPTYLTYVSPHFRVKVGNFRNRAEAEDIYRQASTLYNPCMIVPDIVVINTTRNDN